MRKLFIAVAAALSFAAASDGRAQNTAIIRGRVVSPDLKAIAGAEVRLRGTSGLALSDSAGVFEIGNVDAGHVVIDARRLGYLAQQFELDLAPGSSRRVQLTLPVVAADLPTVHVTDTLGKPARYANTHRYDQFFERKAVGIGKFITREQIDAASKSNTAELLQGMSGVKVRRIGNEWKVQFTRCQMGIPGIDDPSEFIQVFINGHYVGRASQLNDILPAEIEMMEVYKSPTELPPAARGNGCGAVFIWTRNGS